MSSVMPPLDLDDAFAPLPAGDQQVAQLRVPPHSMESESSVLGGLLLDNNAWERVGDLLVDGDFYRHEHKLIYEAIGKLINGFVPNEHLLAYLGIRQKNGNPGHPQTQGKIERFHQTQ